MNLQSSAYLVGTVALVLTACTSSGGAGATTGTGGAGGVGSCARTFGDGGNYTYYAPGCTEAITKGGVPCADDAAGAMAYDALVACASSSCASECTDLVMTQGPATSACSTCLSAHCATPLGTCEHDLCYPGHCDP